MPGTTAYTRATSRFVTGTEASILCGDNPYVARDAHAAGFGNDTHAYLVAKKAGRVPPLVANHHMQRGIREEQEAGELFEALTGLELAREPIGNIRSEEMRVCATPDRRCLWVPLLIEIKSKATRFSLPGIEPNYWWQMQTQMAVTGLRHNVYFQYISSRRYGDWDLPHACMHLVPFAEDAWNAYLSEHLRPFVSRLDRETTQGDDDRVAIAAPDEPDTTTATTTADGAAPTDDALAAAMMRALEAAMPHIRAAIGAPVAAARNTGLPRRSVPFWVRDRATRVGRDAAVASVAATGGPTEADTGATKRKRAPVAAPPAAAVSAGARAFAFPLTRKRRPAPRPVGDDEAPPRDTLECIMRATLPVALKPTTTRSRRGRLRGPGPE